MKTIYLSILIALGAFACGCADSEPTPDEAFVGQAIDEAGQADIAALTSALHLLREGPFGPFDPARQMCWGEQDDTQPGHRQCCTDGISRCCCNTATGACRCGPGGGPGSPGNPTQPF